MKKFETSFYKGGHWNGTFLCEKYKKYLGMTTKNGGVICRYYTCYGKEQGQFAIEYHNSNVTSWINAEDIETMLT